MENHFTYENGQYYFTGTVENPFTTEEEVVDEVADLKTLHNCAKAAQELSALQERKTQLTDELIEAIPHAIEDAVAAGLGKVYGTA